MKLKSIMTAFASIVAFAATTAHAAQTTEQSCLTQPELQALIASIMPDAVRGLVGVCRPALPAGAYLQKNGDALIAAFDAEARSSVDAAGVAMRKVAGVKGEISAALSAEALVKVKQEIGVELTKEIKPKDCPGIDRLLFHASALSPANFAGLLGAVGTIVEAGNAEKAGKGGKTAARKKSSFPPICPITFD